MNDHLSPVGKPAPPRPRSPDSFTMSMTRAGSMARACLAEVAGEEDGLARMRLVGIAHYLYFLTISGTRSGVTDSMKSSSIRMGVAKPQAPRHSTSITVHLPSGLVAPSSLAPVAASSAWTTASAPQMLQGDVVHTCTKCFPTGCWWYIV